MKTALNISLLLNLGFAGWLVLSWVAGSKTPVPPKLQRVPAPPLKETAPAANAIPPRLEPFRWDQLYAKDYRVYVKNLRAAGCPESTVRTIVAADVHAVFHLVAAQLEKKLSDLAGGSWASQLAAQSNSAALRQELQRLPGKEAAMVASYLGETRSAPSPVPLPRRLPAAVDPNAPLVSPLVAQPVDLAALNLDQSQLQAVTDLQQAFLEKIGGPDQDPNDSAYQARWRAAQAEVDHLLQGMLGNQAFQEYQIQVYANAQANPQSSTPPADSGPSEE